MDMRMTSTSHKYLRLGFSMIELLIVVSILGIMATLIGAAIPRMIRHNRVNRATTVIASDIQNAFAVAARQREPVRIEADNVGRSYQFADRKSGAVLRIRTFYGDASEYNLDTLTFTPATVDVFPSGVSSNPLSIHISIGDYSKQITASTAGFVRVAR